SISWVGCCKRARWRCSRDANKKRRLMPAPETRRRHCAAIEKTAQPTERFTAFGPLPRLSGSVSKVTFWPSSRPDRPDAWTAEMCTNTSFWPSSGVMNPKPLTWLKNLTVPLCDMGRIPLLPNYACEPAPVSLVKIQVTSVLYWGRRNSHFTLDPCGFLLTRDLPGAFFVSYAGACYSSLRAGKCPNIEILDYFADRSKRNFSTCYLSCRHSCCQQF